MPYSADKYPASWKNEPADVRAKAVEMVNAMLREGMAEDKAIPMALASARKAMSGKKEMVEEFADASGADGVWRTVNGRRIFIKEGQSATDAMEESLIGDKAQSKEDHRKAMTYHANMAKRAAQNGDKALAAKHEKALEAHVTAHEKGDKASSAKANVRSDEAHYSEQSRSVEFAQHSNSVRGVEIFAPGVHNGDAYTEQDIDDMVAAHAALDFRPAIKIGHTKDAPGAPAYGWVTNLRKAGGKLVADFESMHDSVINALKNRSYDRVSSEVYFNLKRGGKSFRRALKAVALLGADVPAVAGLTPLHKMEFAADGFESVAACEQSLDVKQQAIIDSLTERVAALNEANEALELEREVSELETQVAEFVGDLPGHPFRGNQYGPGSGEKGKLLGPDEMRRQFVDHARQLAKKFGISTNMASSMMRDAMNEIAVKTSRPVDNITAQEIYKQVIEKSTKEQNMTIKELQQKKADLEAQLAALRAKGADEDKAKIAKFEQDLSALGTQIASATDDAASKEDENQRLRATVSLLMEKDRAREVAEKVAKCTVKAFHADLEAIYTHAAATPAKVKHYAVADGKRVETEKPLMEVVDALVAHINSSSKRLFEVVTDGGDRRRAEGPSGDSAGAEIDQKVKARIADGKSKDYAEAMEAVLAAEPELAVRYNEEQAAARQAS